MRALISLLFLAPLPAMAQETVDVGLQLSLPEPPIAAGLASIRMEHEASPFGANTPPSGEAPFCLYIPEGGLEVSIHGMHDGAGGFQIRTDDAGDPAISYSITLEDLITGEGVLGAFAPDAPLLIDRPGLSDEGECAMGDNVSLNIAFPEALEASFSKVVAEELTPGRTYEYSDVITISFSAPL